MLLLLLLVVGTASGALQEGTVILTLNHPAASVTVIPGPLDFSRVDNQPVSGAGTDWMLELRRPQKVTVTFGDDDFVTVVGLRVFGGEDVVKVAKGGHELTFSKYVPPPPLSLGGSEVEDVVPPGIGAWQHGLEAAGDLETASTFSGHSSDSGYSAAGEDKVEGVITMVIQLSRYDEDGTEGGITRGGVTYVVKALGTHVIKSLELTTKHPEQWIPRYKVPCTDFMDDGFVTVEVWKGQGQELVAETTIYYWQLQLTPKFSLKLDQFEHLPHLVVDAKWNPPQSFRIMPFGKLQPAAYTLTTTPQLTSPKRGFGTNPGWSEIVISKEKLKDNQYNLALTAQSTTKTYNLPLDKKLLTKKLKHEGYSTHARKLEIDQEGLNAQVTLCYPFEKAVRTTTAYRVDVTTAVVDLGLSDWGEFKAAFPNDFMVIETVVELAGRFSSKFTHRKWADPAGQLKTYEPTVDRSPAEDVYKPPVHAAEKLLKEMFKSTLEMKEKHIFRETRGSKFDPTKLIDTLEGETLKGIARRMAKSDLKLAVVVVGGLSRDEPETRHTGPGETPQDPRFQQLIDVLGEDNPVIVIQVGDADIPRVDLAGSNNAVWLDVGMMEDVIGRYVAEQRTLEDEEGGASNGDEYARQAKREDAMKVQDELKGWATSHAFPRATFLFATNGKLVRTIKRRQGNLDRLRNMLGSPVAFKADWATGLWERTTLIPFKGMTKESLKGFWLGDDHQKNAAIRFAAFAKRGFGFGSSSSPGEQVPLTSETHGLVEEDLSHSRPDGYVEFAEGQFLKAPDTEPQTFPFPQHEYSASGGLPPPQQGSDDHRI